MYVSVFVVFVCTHTHHMCLCVSVGAFACFLYVCYPVHVCINLSVIKYALYHPKVTTIALCNSLL